MGREKLDTAQAKLSKASPYVVTSQNVKVGKHLKVYMLLKVGQWSVEHSYYNWTFLYNY